MSDEIELTIAERVERLKIMLVSMATGGPGDNSEYQEMRELLFSQSELAHRTPSWMRTYRNLSEFWQFIKAKFARYSERREFLRSEFERLQLYLEDREPAVPTEAGLVLDRLDAGHVRELWQRMLDRRTADPDGAITAARTLVESTCKHLLEVMNVPYPSNAELGGLYGLAAKHLRLAPDQYSEQIFKQVWVAARPRSMGLRRFETSWATRMAKDDRRHGRHGVTQNSP